MTGAWLCRVGLHRWRRHETWTRDVERYCWRACGARDVKTSEGWVRLWPRV